VSNAFFRGENNVLEHFFPEENTKKHTKSDPAHDLLNVHWRDFFSELVTPWSNYCQNIVGSEMEKTFFA